MAIDGINSTGLEKLAFTLLEQDEDKIITKEELEKFIQDNDAELVALNIDADSAASELKNILSDNYQETTEETSSSSQSVEDYNKLKEKVAQLESALSEYGVQRSALISTQSKLASELEEEQAKYDKLEQQLAAENKDYEKIINKINDATSAMEADVAHQQKQAAYSAMADYDPETDGDWDEYLKDYIADTTIDSAFRGTISKLVSQSDFAQLNLKSLGSQLSKQGRIVNDLAAQYTSTTQKIADLDNIIATTNVSLAEAKEELQNSVIGLVSEEEWALVEANNIDLKEKLPDGSPRYIFAQGANDGKYHIYDMGDPGCSSEGGTVYYRSLAREYACGQGMDIVDWTNGWISTLGNPTEEVGPGYYKTSGTVMYMNDCGKMESFDTCYSTASPLAFDLDGDGVKTSNKVVDFDIDGDGKVDKINDSGDAVLVFDKDHNGKAGEDGSECFGNNTDLDGDGKADGYKDGFEALKALALKEGLINGNDDNVLDEADLKILEEKWGLGIKKDGYTGETSSLADAGITEINLAATDKTTLEDNFDGNGNQLMRQEGATFKVNGETREYADIWHRKLDETQGSDNFFNGSNSSSLSFETIRADEAGYRANTSADIIKANAQKAVNKLKKGLNENLFMQLVNKPQSALEAEKQAQKEIEAQAEIEAQEAQEAKEEEAKKKEEKEDK